MTNRRGLWIGSGMFLGLFFWLIVAVGLGYWWAAKSNAVWVFILAGALLGWICTRLFRIE